MRATSPTACTVLRERCGGRPLAHAEAAPGAQHDRLGKVLRVLSVDERRALSGCIQWRAVDDWHELSPGPGCLRPVSL